MTGKSYLQFIDLFLHAEQGVQKSILRAADPDFIQYVGEVALNILEGVVPLSPYFKRKLKPHAQVIRSLGSSRVKQVTRRKLCVKHTALVARMLTAALPYLRERFA